MISKTSCVSPWIEHKMTFHWINMCVLADIFILPQLVQVVQIFYQNLFMSGHRTETLSLSQCCWLPFRTTISWDQQCLFFFFTQESHKMSHFKKKHLNVWSCSDIFVKALHVNSLLEISNCCSKSQKCIPLCAVRVSLLLRLFHPFPHVSVLFSPRRGHKRANHHSQMQHCTCE